MQALQDWPAHWDDWGFELVKLVDANEDQVVALSRHYFTGTYMSMEQNVVFVHTLRGGKSVRMEMFLSLEDALEAVELRE